MAEKDYNNVELTEEETQSLNDDLLQEIPLSDGGETTESQDEPAVQTAEEATEEEPSVEEVNEAEVEDSFDGFEIDGQKFDREDILAWREDSSNKSDWSKSNTEKAQQLSKWNKLAEKINNDTEFKSHIEDFFFDSPEALKALGLDGDITLPEVQEELSEIPSAIEARLGMLEHVEGERIMEHRVDVLDGVLANLEKEYPDYLGEGEKVGEFLEFADQNAEKFVEGDLCNLERAFREWSYGQMQEQLNHYKKLDKNGARNAGKVIGTAQVGAKEVKTDKKLTWNDVTMDNPDIAKYFEDK